MLHLPTLVEWIDQLEDQRLWYAHHWSLKKEDWKHKTLKGHLPEDWKFIKLLQMTPSHPWILKLELTHKDFSDSKMIDHLFNIVSHLLHKRIPMIGTLISEMSNNAIDHGILKMQSSMKEGKEGVSAYIQERINKLNKNQEGYLKVVVVGQPDETGHIIYLSFRDSGEGYSVSNQFELKSADQYYGRGLTLLKALSNDFYADLDGKRTTVSLKVEDTQI